MKKEPGYDAFFSSNGQFMWITEYRDGVYYLKIYRILPDGSIAQEPLKEGKGSSIGFSPNGQFMWIEKDRIKKLYSAADGKQLEKYLEINNDFTYMCTKTIDRIQIYDGVAQRPCAYISAQSLKNNAIDINVCTISFENNFLIILQGVHNDATFLLYNLRNLKKWQATRNTIFPPLAEDEVSKVLSEYIFGTQTSSATTTKYDNERDDLDHNSNSVRSSQNSKRKMLNMTKINYKQRLLMQTIQLQSILLPIPSTVIVITLRCLRSFS